MHEQGVTLSLKWQWLFSQAKNEVDSEEKWKWNITIFRDHRQIKSNLLGVLLKKRNGWLQLLQIWFPVLLNSQRQLLSMFQGEDETIKTKVAVEDKRNLESESIDDTW